MVWTLILSQADKQKERLCYTWLLKVRNETSKVTKPVQNTQRHWQYFEILNGWSKEHLNTTKYFQWALRITFINVVGNSEQYKLQNLMPVTERERERKREMFYLRTRPILIVSVIGSIPIWTSLLVFMLTYFFLGNKTIILITKQ
jgi:hypothetical protein